MVENIASLAAKEKNANKYGYLRLNNIQISQTWSWSKKGIQSKGRSISGLTAKLHLAITSGMQIIEGFITGGNRADISFADDLTREIYECYVIADKGYDSNQYRDTLESQNNIPVIPGRKNRKKVIEYDKEKFRLRKLIENFFAKIKENRRLALRFEKSDLAFLGFIAVATIKMHLC